MRFWHCIFILLFNTLKAQDLSFKSESIEWPDNFKIHDAIPDSLKNNEAVILNDQLIVNLIEGTIIRRQAIKVLKAEGLAKLKTLSLPQNMDITAQENSFYKQGRFSTRTIPFIYSYKIDYFSARILRNRKIYDLPLDVTTKKNYWVKRDGERVSDYEYNFHFEDLNAGDILEYIYKLKMDGSYGTDQFYVHDYYPKLKMNLVVDAPISYAHNIDSTACTISLVTGNGPSYFAKSYTFTNLKAIKYGQNCLAGMKLPHVSASPYSVSSHVYNATMTSAKVMYATRYSWYIVPDSLYFKEKVYDKSGASLRKFIKKFPDDSSDITHAIFLSKVVDTLNTYRFLSAEQMHYGADAQYSIRSSERLLRRELAEEFISDIYKNILFEKGVFYYVANVQDRRLGGHSPSHRTHDKYEREFIALPVKKSFKFYLPRFEGLKYLPDELPYYYEGTLCALIPKNTQALQGQTQDVNTLKFIKTPLSTHNENVRTENAIFKINVDSGLIKATIKENLSGQFSTLLRHYYNRDYIDSTIELRYFKKCVDKPDCRNQQLKLISLSKTFPFKASYNCSEEIRFKDRQINLNGWFSFVNNKDQFKNKLCQEYYMDFAYTDIYNFLFEFNTPVKVQNTADFNKALLNDFFEINSALTQQDESKYLLTITAKVKKYVIPENESQKLIDYVEFLNQLNNLNLKF